MKNLRAFFRRVTGTMSSSRRDREMADEIECHLQLHIDDNVRAGMTPTEARRHALLKFGPVERMKDDYRDRAGLPVVRHIGQDLRFAARLLRKAPLFSVAAIVTIALSIGVNAAVFTVFNAAALQPLRTPQSDALLTVALRLEGAGPRGVHGVRSLLSLPEFTAVRDQVRAFSGTLAYSPFNPVTLGGAEPHQILAT